MVFITRRLWSKSVWIECGNGSNWLKNSRDSSDIKKILHIHPAIWFSKQKLCRQEQQWAQLIRKLFKTNLHLTRGMVRRFGLIRVWISSLVPVFLWKYKYSIGSGMSKNGIIVSCQHLFGKFRNESRNLGIWWSSTQYSVVERNMDHSERAEQT